MVINFKFYTFPQFLGSIFFQIITFVAIVSLLTDTTVTLIFVCLLAYHQHLRIDKINYEIERVCKPNCSPHQISIAIKRFNEEHNRFIMQLWNYNKYWKHLYLIFIMLGFPGNLVIMHQILFESMELHIRVFLVLSILLNDGILFGLQLIYALFSKKVHKMCSNLSRLQWRVNGFPFRMRTKIKLLVSFERLSSKKKIGITIGGVVMTFQIFYLVSRIISNQNQNIMFIIKSLYFNEVCGQVYKIFHPGS